MARINVEQKALSDPRYARLGQLLKTSRHDALGRMCLAWNECQERETYYLSAGILQGIFERDDAGELLVRAELARATKTKGFYIKGSKGRIEWLASRRKDGRKGGRPRKTLRLTLGGDGKLPTDNPPAPAPAPALKKRNRKNTPEYTPRFLFAWSRYPHYEQRSVKSESFKVWRSLDLESDERYAGVGLWMEAGIIGREWTKNGGEFVKGFQSWLRKTDFMEPPPDSEQSPMQARRAQEQQQHSKQVHEKYFGGGHGQTEQI